MTVHRFFQLLLVLVAGSFLAACGGNNKTSQTSTAVPTAAQFTGPFAFSANGNDPADGSFFVAGSLTADGKGGITGVEDLNLGSGVDSSVPFTGTYQVDSSGNVTVTISDATGTPTILKFPFPSGSTTTKIDYNGSGTGTLQSQSTTAFSNVGNFTFTLNGEGEGTVTGSGAFTTGAAGTITIGNEKFQDGNYSRNASTLSGSLSPAFDGGRGTAVIGDDNFSYYVVSQNQIILAGLEDRILIFGSATKQ